jgi:hypothetical protein
MSGSQDSTRPISVAELLARNGTIGAPPVGGRRRRMQRQGEAHSQPHQRQAAPQRSVHILFPR